MSNGTDQVQPPPENKADPAVSTPRKRASPGDSNWLPSGWTTEDRVRTSGTKAGIVDKFYYEPVTGRKFRSKKEVMYYLEHGTPKKTIKKAKNGDTQSEPSEDRGSYKRQTKSNKKANEKPQSPAKPLDFDFLNVPEKVMWTGTNGSEEAWWPFIGDYKIQESVSHEWDRAFTLVTAKNVGKTTV
ncbi:hypothetical protein EUTSA_v10002683mg [Eutrema salsugineum]|uniref:MBD domain-containing protein n=1 Tax=Eutrema salsugineum TaxID=72664 RepID=V4KHK2_EUTSA|nr:methyl-CpG-binding domain-containing protein 5 [Eutrema salsugineum]ESQ37320.1 hypothetical protein EUTSA_v10002683mg [Eutrema salsugineum]